MTDGSNEEGKNLAPRERNEAIAAIHMRSALSMGVYGKLVNGGWIPFVNDVPVDKEMRELGLNCWRWSWVCFLLFPALLGLFGGGFMMVALLITAAIPRRDLGFVFYGYEILVMNAYLVVLVIYAKRAARSSLEGGAYRYPCSSFRLVNKKY
ncbi:MAG: hypothetical protein ACP5O1_04325 [Phycisphaerae bacterium]